MRQFAGTWPDSQIPQQPVAELPWGHIRHLVVEIEHFMIELVEAKAGSFAQPLPVAR
jgi:hypothetical protein